VEDVCVCNCVCNCVCACMRACVSVCMGGWLSEIGVGKVECAPAGPFWSIFRVPQSNQPRFYVFLTNKYEYVNIHVHVCVCIDAYICTYLYICAYIHE